MKCSPLVVSLQKGEDRRKEKMHEAAGRFPPRNLPCLICEDPKNRKEKYETHKQRKKSPVVLRSARNSAIMHSWSTSRSEPCASWSTSRFERSGTSRRGETVHTDRPKRQPAQLVVLLIISRDSLGSSTEHGRSEIVYWPVKSEPPKP